MRRVPVLALLLFGCAKNGAEGMVILANTAPAGTACVFTGDPMQPAFSSGEISAESTNAYLLTPLIESRISPAGSGANVDRSILLGGAIITLTNNATQIATFETPVSGTIPPGGTLNVAFPIIPVDVLATFANGSAQTVVVADVTVFGTEGGGDLNAEPFTYGITVCPKDAPCVINNIGSCVGLTATVAPGNPCNPFQDGLTDCCTSGSNLICPAVSEAGSGM